MARLNAQLGVGEAAEKAGLSRRYFAEIEAGRGNPSIGRLAQLASALDVPLPQLCDLPTRTAPKERIALIGMRGAGKSTLGKRLSAELEIPFAELDDLICERAGLSLPEIFELHGTEGYRALEGNSLEAWLAGHGQGVLALPGGIVHSPATYQRLLSTCRCVWLQATADQHMARVVAQGDLRPMANQPEAMQTLKAMLLERTEQYQRAELHLDTSQAGVAESAAQLSDLLAD